MAFVAVVLATLFRHLRPEHVEADYDRCKLNWHEARLATCGGVGCRERLCKVPQQPVNTYSNLWYLLWGTLLAAGVGTAAAAVFAVGLAFLCIGSALYHAISTHWAHLLDECGIYATYAALFGYSLSIWAGIPEAWMPVPMLALMCGAVGMFGARFKRTPAEGAAPDEYEHRDTVIAALLTPAVFLPLFAAQATWPWVAGAVVCFALGFGVWWLDRNEKLPVMGGVAWGHGAWHLLTAFATALVFAANTIWLQA